MWHLNTTPKVLPGDGVSGNIAANISPETAGGYTARNRGASDRQPQWQPDLKGGEDQTLVMLPESWTLRLWYSFPTATNLLH